MWNALHQTPRNTQGKQTILVCHRRYRIVITQFGDEMAVEMNLDIQDSHNDRDDIEARIAKFKQDPDKMDEMNVFLDEVLSEAQKSVEVKLQDKSADERPRNGNKLLSGLKQHRVVTRTRGIVLRIFEAICNCTNSGPLPGQRPAGAAPAASNVALPSEK